MRGASAQRIFVGSEEENAMVRLRDRAGRDRIRMSVSPRASRSWSSSTRRGRSWSGCPGCRATSIWSGDRISALRIGDGQISGAIATTTDSVGERVRNSVCGA
jgi:hypothetical protein